MKRYYFLVTSILLLVLWTVAFSDNLITDVGQKSNSDPKYIIHGLYCYAWFFILVIQTNFIRKADYKTHIKFGIAGLSAAVGVFLTTLYIFVVIYKGWDNMSYLVKANRFFMLGFAILVTLGYINRSQSSRHKRFMYIATLYMLGPILDRAMGRLSFDSIISNPDAWDATFHGIWTLFFISLFIYGQAILKKNHPVTYLGFAGYCIIWILWIIA